MIGSPAINLARLQADLDALSDFREPDQPGWTRRVFSEPYVRSREWVAQRMSEAKRNIPHFAYVEEVDVTELESLRLHLNSSRPADAGSLSYLPFVVMALTRVLSRRSRASSS